MLTAKDRQRFERLTLPHLTAAYNLALCLVRNTAEADDIVQTAYLKAFEAFDRFTGNSAAAWIMTIVRNTAFTHFNKIKRNSNLVSFDEVLHQHAQVNKNSFGRSPEDTLSQHTDKVQISACLDRLKTEYREALFLRDIEGYSYKEISDITQVPKGTVMSRLSRAREQLQKMLLAQQTREQRHEM